MTEIAAKEFPTEAELESRVEEIRGSAPASKELVDAILEYVATLWFKPAVAEPLIEEALEICEKTDYTVGRARALVPKAFLRFIKTEYSACIPILAEALPVIVEHRTTNEYGRAMLLLSATNQISGAYDQALEYSFRLLEVDEGSRDEELLAWMNYRIADIYRELGDSEQELEYAQNCYDAFEDLHQRSGRLQHRVGMGRARTQLAAAYQKAGKVEEALSYNEVALAQYHEANDRLGETRALTDIGRLHLMRGDQELGEEYLLEALEIRREIGHRASQSSNLLELGKLYTDRGDTDRAVEVLEEGLAISDEANLKMRAYELHEALSRVYKARGDLGQALGHHEQFHALKEEVAGEAMSLKIHDRKVLAEIERAERDAEIERAKSEELKAKNEELAALLAELRTTQDRLIHSEKMASLGQLTAGIAHEIRNPLNFVNNFSALSSEIVAEMTEAFDRFSDRLDDEQRSELKDHLETLVFNTTRIKEHGARADKIVANMIDHSRVGTHQRTVVDLNEMIEEYVILAHHALTARDDKFLVHIDRNYDQAAGEIELVPQEIGRVVLNLIGNAFDALRANGEWRGESGELPTVTVSTSKTETSGNKAIEIRVSDNGPGIPDDVKSKIFEPFFTTKPTGSGTGLGLSMSYDIVTKGHGGSLEVESIEGEGATFIVRLPA